ncbi:DUF1648 domain-containing protein [Streptomyces sp. NPDC047315]|uniref:DUF1648 domain-containing protein n=1 Tax=Streptomyces sp. NPDC047315 TaxID=3155142 RepID=UPI00340DBBB0
MARPDHTSHVPPPHLPPSAALRWSAAVPCLLAALLVAAVFAVSWSDLPDPMAVHFDAGGGADRSASPAQLLLLSELVLLGLGAALALGAVRRTPNARTPNARTPNVRTVYAASTATAVLLGYLFTVAVLVNADAASADEVRLPLWHLAVAAGLAAIAAAGVRVLVPEQPPARADRDDRPADNSSVGLRHGERAVWVRSVGPRWLVAAAVLAAVAAVTAGALGWVPGFWLAPVALLVAVLPGSRVIVDGTGLTVRPPVLPAPRIHVPLERIVRAWTAEARPLPDLGGWGYRIAPGRRGLALRSGPAVWLELVDGKEFIVVVDDAATATGLLTDLLAADTGNARRDARRDDR